MVQVAYAVLLLYYVHVSNKAADSLELKRNTYVACNSFDSKVRLMKV